MGKFRNGIIAHNQLKYLEGRQQIVTRMLASTFLESLREYFSQLGFEIKLLRHSCFSAWKPESLACRSCTGDRPSPNDPPITLVVIKFSGNVSKFSASLSMPFAVFKADVRRKEKEKQKKYFTTRHITSLSKTKLVEFNVQSHKAV